MSKFVENDHPRDESGKFTTKGGSNSNGAKKDFSIGGNKKKFTSDKGKNYSISHTIDMDSGNFESTDVNGVYDSGNLKNGESANGLKFNPWDLNEYINYLQSLGFEEDVEDTESEDNDFQLSDSDKQVIDDSVYFATKNNPNATIEDVFSQLQEDMNGFISNENKGAITKYLKSKGFVTNDEDKKKAGKQFGVNII